MKTTFGAFLLLVAASDQVKVEQGRSFAGFGFTLALQNLRDRLVQGKTFEL